ncbi:hypothetical protein [Phormidium pseudopriestleyi]|nr:hypothetical protein [Phormidium pseudopriestleyi]
MSENFSECRLSHTNRTGDRLDGLDAASPLSTNYYGDSNNG